MATKTLTDLPEALTVINSDLMHIQTSGTDKKTTGDRVAKMALKNSSYGERILSYANGSFSPASSDNLLTSIIADSTAGNTTITLPTDVGVVAGSIVFVAKKVTANTVSIVYSGATLVLPAGIRSGAIFQWSGTAWTGTTNAYTDYVTTASELLTRIKTVDGAGSGLDADLLDGINSVQMVYGDDAHATTSTTSANGIVKSGFYRIATPFTGAPTAAEYFLMHAQSSATDNEAFQVAMKLGSVNDYYTRSKTGGVWGSWNQIWHAGNDGAGSGLDADLLDGLSSARYLLSNAQGTTTTNMDTLVANGLYYTSSTATGRPSGAGAGSVLVADLDTDRKLQVFWEHSTQKQWVRTMTTNVWSSWNQYWSAGNDGAGSGLDADTVDGIDSAALLQRADYLITDFATFNYDGLTAGKIYTLYTNFQPTNRPAGGANYFSGFMIKNNVAGSTFVTIFITSATSTPQSWLATYTTALSAWAPMWNSATDGAGSGLDADLLDGISSGSFLLRTDFTLSDLNAVVPSGISGSSATFVTSVNPANKPGSANYFSGIIFKQSISSNYATMIAFDSGNGAWIRYAASDVWQTWYPLWSGVNDGSGSGLDADLFDGIDSTWFVYGGGDKAATIVTDANTPTKSGFYSLDSPYTNGPAAASCGILHVQHQLSNANSAFQLARRDGADTGDLWMRTKASGSWNAWIKLWSAGNDGAGSGLDADLLDGLNTAAAATASTVMTRDAAGRSKVVDPSASDDIATKGYVDASAAAGVLPDVRFTAGGGRNEQVSAMAVGEVRQLSWNLQNNTGASVNMSIITPATGTFQFNGTFLIANGRITRSSSAAYVTSGDNATAAANSMVDANNIGGANQVPAGSYLCANIIIKRIS